MPDQHLVLAARAEKARKVFPRPVAGALRPVVHGQTVKYNLKKRYGRGFTLDELKVLVWQQQAAAASARARHAPLATDAPSRPVHKTALNSNVLQLQEAGFSARKARTIGIAVDHRRKNRSLESLQVCWCTTFASAS